MNKASPARRPTASPEPLMSSGWLSAPRLWRQKTAGEPVQFNEVTEVEVLHPQLMLDEGETTTLTLFRLLSGQTRPVTVTLEIEEPDERFLSVSSTQFVIIGAGGGSDSEYHSR